MADVREPIGPPERPRGVLRRARAAWPFDVLDILAAGGLVLLHLGLSLKDPALPWIVDGVVVMVYAFVAALPPRGGTA